jgi:small subunit ribosomal protein S5
MGLKKNLFARRVTVNDCGELKDRTVFINRVAKVVKGGRRFSFSALVVTGDGQGHVGYGLGKAAEVPEAIRKASEAARTALIRVPIKGTTIPHDITMKSGPCRIVLKPGAPGTGVIAGSAVRAVVEAAGIKDIRTKCIGSSNPNNVLHAVFDSLLTLKEPEAVAATRNISVEDMGYAAF